MWFYLSVVSMHKLMHCMQWAMEVLAMTSISGDGPAHP